MLVLRTVNTRIKLTIRIQLFFLHLSQSLIGIYSTVFHCFCLYIFRRRNSRLNFVRNFSGLSVISAAMTFSWEWPHDPTKLHNLCWNCFTIFIQPNVPLSVDIQWVRLKLKGTDNWICWKTWKLQNTRWSFTISID